MTILKIGNISGYMEKLREKKKIISLTENLQKSFTKFYQPKNELMYLERVCMYRYRYQYIYTYTQIIYFETLNTKDYV